jgi:protein Mpv17
MAGATFITLWRGYTRLLEKYPWRTQAANTGLLLGAGDLIAQMGVERRSPMTYEGTRTLRFLGVGVVVFGPGMHWWYSSLDRIVRGSCGRAALKKVFMDQAFFLPFYLASFIALMACLRREDVKEIKRKFDRDFGPMLLTSYGLWPAVQIVNFAMVPMHHRVLVINFVGLLWNTYLAWKAEAKD